jgi:agmatine/peptidylarginine deiminase
MLRLETMVDEYLQQHDNLKHYSYRDQPLPCAPTRRRPDFTYILPDRVVVLEVDEDAHKFYNRECECIRILELSEQANGLPLVVIRFNPKKRLLHQLKKMLEDEFINSLNSMIRVVFLGYNEEYDVMETINSMLSASTPERSRSTVCPVVLYNLRYGIPCSG